MSDEGVKAYACIQSIAINNGFIILTIELDKRESNRDLARENKAKDRLFKTLKRLDKTKMSKEFKVGMTPFAFSDPGQMKVGVYRDENTGLLYRNDGSKFTQVNQESFDREQKEYADIAEVDPAKYKNEIVLDTETGIKYYSDGKQFVEATPEEDWAQSPTGVLSSSQ